MGSQPEDLNNTKLLWEFWQIDQDRFSFSLSCVCLVSSSLSIPSPSLYVLRLQYGYMPALLCIFSPSFLFFFSLSRCIELKKIHIFTLDIQTPHLAYDEYSIRRHTRAIQPETYNYRATVYIHQERWSIPHTHKRFSSFQCVRVDL